jgi:hypothetical protein
MEEVWNQYILPFVVSRGVTGIVVIFAEIIATIFVVQFLKK